MKMRWTTHSFRRNFQHYYINLQTVYTNTNSASCKAGCQIWPILGIEFRKAVTALLKEAVLLSLQKHIYCSNFVNIVKLFKCAIKYLLACTNYSATLRMINYPALPVPALTVNLLVVTYVQLPRPHHFYEHWNYERKQVTSPLTTHACGRHCDLYLTRLSIKYAQ